MYQHNMKEKCKTCRFRDYIEWEKQDYDKCAVCDNPNNMFEEKKGE